jgi:4-amino-4-deoxy-L-arabinose transferase-like glycosyltransferase
MFGRRMTGAIPAADAGRVSHAHHRRRATRRDWLARILIVAVFFAAVAPTLAWLEFFHAEENVVIAQALEMRRTHNWLIPTLQGRPRTIKPPLTVWITAAAIHEGTLRRLDSADEAVRASAYRQLSFQTRWPTVLASGLMLVAVYELGRAIGGTSMGLIGAFVCGSTWFLLVRQGSKNTVDLQLALWVCTANAFLAWGALRGRWWTACIGGGVALGLATMSKGPAVPLLQSVIPVAVYMLWCRYVAGQPTQVRIPRSGAVVGALLMLGIGLSWYVAAYLRYPDIAPVWWAELTRHGANDLRDPWPQYLRAMRLMYPWLIWLIIGVAAGVMMIVRKRNEPWMLAFFLALLPLLVMQLFNERKERYLIPLIGPLSLIAAHVVHRHVQNVSPHWETWEKLAVPIHWVGLAALAVGLPIAGAVASEQMHTTSGGPWFSLPLAAIALVAMLGILVAGMTAYRRNRAALVVTSVMMLLVAQVLYVWGFSHDPAGTRDQRAFADFIWANYPTATLYSSYGGDRPGIVFTPGVDLAIYTNRNVTPVNDITTLRPTDRPLVVLAQFRRREAEAGAPVGWREVRRLEQQNGDVCKLFVLPPAAAGALQ